MPADVKPLVLTFKGGLNLLSDETAVADDQLTEAMNFDQDLDGSLRSRPPFADIGEPLTLGASGQPKILGWFYGSGVAYLLASDGLSKTWAFNTTSQTWADTGATYAASAMVQFDDKAWLLQPGVGQGGGYWVPGTFTAEANMPRGTTIASHKSRLWIARGKGATNGGTVYYSEVLGASPFWPASPDLQKIGFGDGQDIVYLVSYYQSLIIFRTESIWSWQYTADPAAGVIGVIVPGVGLQNEDCVAAFENTFYFMYDNKAYAFVNNRAEQLNAHVPFEAINPNVAGMTAAVSVFNRRVLFAYYDVIYVFNLNTQTWTRWRSTTYSAVSQVVSSANDPVELGYALKSAIVAPGPGRTAPLLRINDVLSGDQEEMQLVLQTKNYSYQLASNYKRLFWWGADARFRRDIHGSAVPVVYTGQITWGELNDGGVTWGQMLNSSWGSPYIGDSLTQDTDYDLGGVGVQRKFVKFRKSLRFRQIYFRLVFNTDGSISQGPVQLFNLTAYVGTKQTVSKAIT